MEGMSKTMDNTALALFGSVAIGAGTYFGRLLGRIPPHPMRPWLNEYVVAVGFALVFGYAMKSLFPDSGAVLWHPVTVFGAPACGLIAIRLPTGARKEVTGT